MSQLQPFSIGAMLHLSGEPGPVFAKVRELGLDHVQLQYPAAHDTLPGRLAILEAAQKNGVTITTIFCGFAGESYADVPTVQRTVGFVPPGPRAERVALVSRISDFAASLGVSRLGAHIGWIPEDHLDPMHGEVVQVMTQICDEIAPKGQVIALETGQETAAGLRHFLEEVNRPNIKVNFDPANMILYGNDEPNAALDVLYPWIDGVHCKDGKWPTPTEAETGQIGQEVPLGQGDVHFFQWLKKLVALGYQGPLTIEREISGEQQARDIAAARALILATLEDES